jgi:CRISPR/Cas system endoribonuclease Cas6 (RAMP superfamily)
MGLLGRIYYRCRKASAAYTTLVALTRFAFFAGVGAFTEVGMGTTRITIG